MESPPEEVLDHNHEISKEKIANEADDIRDDPKIVEEEAKTDISEPRDPVDEVEPKEDVIDGTSPENDLDSKEVETEVVLESTPQVTSEIADDSVIEVPDNGVNQDNDVLLVEEPAEEKEVVKVAQEVNVIAADISDQNIILSLEESYEDVSETNENVETMSEEVSDTVVVAENSEKTELVEKPILVVEEPETVEPPALEAIADEVATINGMPVLDKEVVNDEVTEEIDESGLIHPVVVYLSNSVNESEGMEAVEQGSSEEPTKDEEPKEIVIPPHILGRNLDRPMSEEFVRNGKVRKPRLGVKIPNRNLTSQIVSQKDIQEEVMERSRLRNANAEDPTGGDMFFAKKLTQRLARKLSEKSSAAKSVAATSSSSEVKPFLNMTDKITNNSDLIALLEGDDDIDWTPTDSSKKLEKKKNPPDWERETALKQLRELPKQGKYKSSPGSKTLTPSTPTKTAENKVTEPMEAAVDDNAEPRFSMGVVTKTYTRKRKSSNDIKIIASSVLQGQKKLHADKDKPPSATSSPHTPQTPSKQSEKSPQKVSENSKSSTPKMYKSKSSSDKKEMPTLKKELPIVNQQHKPSTPKVQKTTDEILSQIPPDKAHPHVLISKSLTPTPKKTPEVNVAVQLSPNTYISKSSRIVKKKKIWDPDEDHTPKYSKPNVVKSPKFSESVEKVSEKKIEKVVEKLVASSEKPAVLKPNNERAIPKKPTMKRMIMKKKKLKKLTEVDRLLMDEGAVNLLYSIKNTEELQNVTKKKTKSTISLDRAQRELLNKTNEIKNDLQINSTKDSPISLRKKESGTIKISPSKEVAAVILQRKKSTGSAHSPPASPAFYNQHAEASRIIRRHSSSSFSSENGEGDGEKSSTKKSGEQKRKIRSHGERHSSSMGVDKQLLSEEMAKNFNRAIPVESKYTQFDTFSVRTYDHFVQIIISPTGPLGQTMLSLQTMMELTELFEILKNDNACRAVLLSSSGDAFCQGIDYKELVSNKESERLNLAENYAKCIKDFLVAVSNFPKILVAGVHGHTVGLGVTMLTLFDMVLASDTATFNTPFASLGSAAEGGVLLTFPRVMHSTLASELFFASRKLTAGEAFRLGLVTRTLWPDKFQDELISSLKITSGQSLQGLQAIKSQLRRHLTANLEKALEDESSLLVQHWTSTECQTKFSDYSIERKPFLT